jgi:hypothetical protein
LDYFRQVALGYVAHFLLIFGIASYKSLTLAMDSSDWRTESLLEVDKFSQIARKREK